MKFLENRLLADISQEINLIFSKMRKDDTKFVVCCSCDWRFKGYSHASNFIEVTSLKSTQLQVRLQQNRQLHHERINFKKGSCYNDIL